MFRKRDLTVGIAILVFLGICLIVPGLAAKKPQPASVWSATIIPTSLAEGSLAGTSVFVPNDYVRTLVSEPSSTNGYTYNFQLTIAFPSPVQLDFSNIGVFQQLYGNVGDSQLTGGISGFLNEGTHPDEDDPYYHIILWFQLPASDVNGIIQGGGTGTLSGGFFYISFGSEFEVNTSLYGFTPLQGLHVTTDANGNWTFGFNQGVDLIEQTTIIEYNRKNKPTSVPFVIQEILTNPVHFNMSWQKIS